MTSTSTPRMEWMLRLRRLTPIIVFFFSTAAHADLSSEVRDRMSAGQVDGARQLVDQERAAHGDSPAALEALSWLARGELAKQRLDDALRDARQTRALVNTLLRSRALDAEPRLPIALGAAIEVEAQALAARGQRADALAVLTEALANHRETSIATRIQKNINLLTLKGKRPPALEREPHFGAPTPTLSSLVGRPVLLFFWAHWCPDCKATAPAVARLASELAPSGLVVIAPTQTYGAIAGGEEAAPAVELPYIDEVRRHAYASLGNTPVPVSAANFRNYGASSVPTIVVIDRAGKVALYHAGKMGYDELRPYLAAAARSLK